MKSLDFFNCSGEWKSIGTWSENLLAESLGLAVKFGFLSPSRQEILNLNHHTIDHTIASGHT